jgi:galactokinase
MAAERLVPVFTNLTELYGSLGSSLDHGVRWNNLVTEFEVRFGKKPAYIARAPGRVNLIGEHIDYSLFGVLPAAIERDILIACAPRNLTPLLGSQNHPLETLGSVVAENLHGKYTRQIFAPAPVNSSPLEIGEDQVRVQGWQLDIDTKELRWESYVKAGYYGVLEHFFTDVSSTNDSPVSVDLLVTGTVPAGSGLSSSAALVVASSLAFLAVNGKVCSLLLFFLFRNIPTGIDSLIVAEMASTTR